MWSTSLMNFLMPIMCCGMVASAHAQACSYVLKMWDTGGDGWQGSTVSVTIDPIAPGPTVTTPYAVAEGYEEVVIPVGIGDQISLTYAPSGVAEQEILFTLELVGSTTNPMYTSGYAPAAGLVYSFTADCLPPMPLSSDCFGAWAYNFTGNGTDYSTPSIAYPFGQVDELNEANQGCLTDGEVHGVWIVLIVDEPNYPGPTGPLELQIEPFAQAVTNYDFAIWGPYSSLDWFCYPTVPPIRCSKAVGAGATGLSSLAFDLSEDENGDGWVAPIWIEQGVAYLMYITASEVDLGFGFSLDAFTVTTGHADASAPNLSSLSVFPNPSDGVVHLRWPGQDGEIIQSVHIRDAAGRIVQRSGISTASPESDLLLRTEGLSRGVYLVEVLDGQGSVVAADRLVIH